ncbi:MAG: hypothetical protein D8M59_12025 [Planctomycetes bacterium]|nr:hypothetical protein [Planctomycetota bacterium]NOG53531.1 hypothetical protein [Planctomycetota bacterium]
MHCTSASRVTTHLLLLTLTLAATSTLTLAAAPAVDPTPPAEPDACTSLLVTSGASTDGSVMITYTCDAEFLPRMQYTPAADYEPGAMCDIKDWAGNVRGSIPQVPHTYAVVDLMNDHQLAIGETTFGGRNELHNPDGLFHYWDLMHLALQRATTARQAVTVMTELAQTHGYCDTGESISIGDKDEAWILELIGKGPDTPGIVWVARKVPDGSISAHANKARIGTFPLDDPDTCLYAEDVISFAVEKGYYDPDAGKPFMFNEAYDPPNPGNKRWADTRVWTIFRRAAPSLNLSPDYHRSVAGAEPYPLWITPDTKLAVSDVFALMRDHYEGTPFDMTQGIDAGPYNTPYRWRPLHWNVDDVTYAWERPVSTQQTAYSFVSQSRANLPDPVGGVYWYGMDDTAFTVYIPFYCCISGIPESFTVGSLGSFSWDSAWWVFNFVANYCNLRYADMYPDILAVQQQLEGNFLALQPAVEQTALHLANENPELMVHYLTDYSLSHADTVVARWKALGEYLIAKYNDGYVQQTPGNASQVGYPEQWLRRVLEDRPDDFKLPQN